METSTSRKILSVAGLLVSWIMVSLMKNAMANLREHLAGAVFYLIIFIFGMIIAVMSVTTPAHNVPAVRTPQQALAEAQKNERKENKTKFWLGIAILGMAVFFLFVGARFIFQSGFSTFMFIIMVVSGVFMIIFSRPKKPEQMSKQTTRQAYKNTIKSMKIKPGKKSGFAIASLVLGIFFFIPFSSVLAIVFGFIALDKIKKENLGGKGMAITGIVFGILGILISFLLLLGYMGGSGV